MFDEVPKLARDRVATAASAVGARTARACDCCMRRRARWHCAADDAYLCQACDVSVHSANPLASQHHRVRLATSSCSSSSRSLHSSAPLDPSDPSWLHSLKRRARTPRAKPCGAKVAVAAAAVTATVVPDLEVEEEEQERSVKDLVYRVPVFDPMLAELCDPVAKEPQKEMEMKQYMAVDHVQPSHELKEFQMSPGNDGDGFAGFHVSDTELADFAADMESLLTGVLGDGAGFNDLGFLQDAHELPEEKPPMITDNINIWMKFDSTVAMQDELRESGAREEKNLKRTSMGAIETKKATMLTLDYEGVISAWSHEGCSAPWFQGEHPSLKAGEPWPDFPAARQGVGAVVAPVTGGEREARVSRYREKRRSRLFSKKIRYEVRKLNAEKRPRMKGRFIKRSAFPSLPPVPKFAPGLRRFAF